MKRFFIDECLSASLAAVAKERGVLADFGPHIGLAGWQDWNIARFAFENDYIVVTNNRRDFLKEYLKHGIHNGLVIIVPNVEREPQIDLFSRVLDHLAEMNDLPVNKVIEILEDGTIHTREWTSDDHDIAHIGNPSWANR
jgi:predicted nuclease of predicted toxin-antitoxin system